MSDDLRLFYFPRACSLAVHIILEETGLNYERTLVDLTTDENRQRKYLALNPTGAVPALWYKGGILTETQAILTCLGDMVPQKKLIPEVGDIQRYRAHEWMNFLSSSVHVYIRSIFRSSRYAGDDAEANVAVAEQGHVNLAASTQVVEQRIGNQHYALGDAFSVCDAYLFIMYLWSSDDRIRRIPERPGWTALARRVWERDSTKRVVAVEQQHRDFTIPTVLTD